MNPQTLITTTITEVENNFLIKTTKTIHKNPLSIIETTIKTTRARIITMPTKFRYNNQNTNTSKGRWKLLEAFQINILPKN